MGGLHATEADELELPPRPPVPPAAPPRVLIAYAIPPLFRTVLLTWLQQPGLAPTPITSYYFDSLPINCVCCI